MLMYSSLKVWHLSVLVNELTSINDGILLKDILSSINTYTEIPEVAMLRL